MIYEFDAELWQWDAKASAWFFVTVPADVSDDIDARSSHAAKGFGSVPVEVTVGSTTWRTSVFPSTQEEAFVLPMKKAVRTAEHLDGGDVASIRLRVIEA